LTQVSEKEGIVNKKIEGRNPFVEVIKEMVNFHILRQPSFLLVAIRFIFQFAFSSQLIFQSELKTKTRTRKLRS